jgi:hypothetical protein
MLAAKRVDPEETLITAGTPVRQVVDLGRTSRAARCESNWMNMRRELHSRRFKSRLLRTISTSVPSLSVEQWFEPA